MTDKEKIELVLRYLCYVDSYIYRDMTTIQNSVIRSPNTRPEDILRVYKARIRYEAFKEFSSDLEKILYEGYGKK